MKQGQILIIVLLIVVVILAVGLSVASRNITNLRTSTQTEQSQRAFTAAEGGVEDVLSRIKSISASYSTGQLANGVSLPPIAIGGDLTAAVNLKSSPFYEEGITTEQVGQVDLNGFTGNQVKVEWVLNKNQQSQNPSDGSASVEVSLVYGSAPNYAIERWYFKGTNPSRAGETITGPIPAGSSDCSPLPTPSSEYAMCKLITITNPPFPSPQILRVKPFWLNTSVKVSSNVATPLPPQKFEIKSTAVTEIGVTRSVEVERSALPHVPAVFDFALFSETELVK